eukprot:COSAG02_NODE_65118_length_259_cov_0.368750_1_plen_76_part_01
MHCVRLVAPLALVLCHLLRRPEAPHPFFDEPTASENFVRVLILAPDGALITALCLLDRSDVDEKSRTTSLIQRARP